MKKYSSPKHRDVRERLKSAIRKGEFLSGDQLPSEGELAERYGVSYMTARRAVSDLVAADILERRSRNGTFVRHRVLEKLERITINLITSAYEGELYKGFLTEGMQTASKHGFNTNIIRLTHGQQDPAVRAISNGEPAIVLLDHIRPTSSLGLAMRSAKGRVVAIDRQMWSTGVPSIYSDAKDDILQAISRFRQAGHTKIAMVVQIPSDDGPTAEVIEWQDERTRAMSLLGYEIGVIPVHVPLYYSPTKGAYEAVLKRLAEDPRITGLLSEGDEITVGVLAACRDSDRAVPSSISLINMGNSPIIEYLTPPVTCIDFDLATKLNIAIDIIKAALSGEAISTAAYVTKSFLVERGSVAPAKLLVR